MCLAYSFTLSECMKGLHIDRSKMIFDTYFFSSFFFERTYSPFNSFMIRTRKAKILLDLESRHYFKVMNVRMHNIIFLFTEKVSWDGIFFFI